MSKPKLRRRKLSKAEIRKLENEASAILTTAVQRTQIEAKTKGGRS